MEWRKQLKLIVSLSVVMLFMPIMAGAAPLNDKMLIPMGHSIGIKMDLTGVFITSDVLLYDDDWLKGGDQVQSVNDIAVSKLGELNNVLSGSADQDEIRLSILRDGVSFQVKSPYEAMKKLLPFLKDSTEGTGTLTYVDPLTKKYGALGHQIIDSSFNSPPSFRAGSIHLSEIDQIRKSKPGNPGYKISTILKDDRILGTISENGIYGIFGKWNSTYSEVLTEPLEIMQPAKVSIGEAKIYTTVKGTKVESFSIQITNIDQDQFLFTLTDMGLLEKTGGILQGMSGSPVIQNGKFAGAVTHMFVDEPEKGAALFLTTMRTGEK